MFFNPRECLFGLGGGVCDRIWYRLTGRRVRMGAAITRKMAQCDPWTDHLSPSTIDNLNKAISAREWYKAKGLVALGTTEDADLYCIALIEHAIKLLSMGEEFFCETTPFYFV